MIGSDSRNEKRAALGRSRPTARAAVIVTLDRDTPGCNATACATPRTRPSRTVTSSMLRRRGAARSTTYMTMANTASITAINHGCPRRSVMNPSKTAPTSAPGIVPRTRAHARR
jgi:hypothetical protein